MKKTTIELEELEKDFSEYPGILNVGEVAKLLRFTKKGIYSLVENRRIPFIKVSNRLRFFKRDVLDCLLENRVSELER